jgi:para-nitrobenzyl esterase
MPLRASLSSILPLALVLAMTSAPMARGADQVRIDSGVVEGIAGSEPGVRTFLGIPYAAPPVGDLRWREPRPVAPWEGVRKAAAFGSRPMQASIYGDMVFLDPGPSEDCLTLNVWTPARSAGERLPVMVWIYGGGFEAGATSEPRQDGARLAGKGVVVVSMNYRLGIFGFFAHPWLTAESGGRPGCNLGIMDQTEALRWVRRNIAAFGGDPGNVTIFGESAGSYSVSLQMASPDARGLFQRAICESGSMVGTLRAPTDRNTRVVSLADSERLGVQVADFLGAHSLAELRAVPADRLLMASTVLPYKVGTKDPPVTVDGRTLLKTPFEVFSEGSEAQVPLLAGWNADENRATAVFGSKRPTAASFAASVRSRYPAFADELLKVYPASSDPEAVRSAGDLACDGFITASVWTMIQMHLATGSPVYAYRFDHHPSIEPGTMVNGAPATADDVGARHASEIPFVFRVLGHGGSKVPWTAEDLRVSETLATYWTQFAKTGSPNGGGLPGWPEYRAKDGYLMMHLAAQPRVLPDAGRRRLEVWNEGP